MWLKDFCSRVHPLRAISPVSVADNTAAASQIIDTADYEGLVFVLATGSVADADMTTTVLVEHGDDSGLSDAAAVPDDMLNSGRTSGHATTPEASAAFQFDDDNETRKIGYHGDKRYVRLTVTPSGNASAALISAVALLFGARRQPTAVPPV